MTQEECASFLGISRRTLQSLESDKADTSSAKYLHYCSLLSSGVGGYKTMVVTGEDLQAFYQTVSSYKHRYCYASLSRFFHEKTYGKVCILYGLRRTGKTTLLFQLLGELDLEKTAYLKAQSKNTMGDLIQDINALREKGIENYLIDEVTLLEDFINSASALSDIYAMLGLKIVLSGTDSLGFAFAEADELYDRSILLHTSYVSFKEFSEVLKQDDIDSYIEYGGTLKAENMGLDDPDSRYEEVAFRDDESTRKYIDTAIARNIQRSLRNNHFGAKFGHLRTLYEDDELTNVINRVIEDMNHEFLLSVLTRRFKSHDLGSARQLLLHKEDPITQTALYNIDEKGVLDRLKEILGIKDEEERKNPLSSEVVGQIKHYLRTLDLIDEVEIRFEDGSVQKRVVFLQPGMRYALSKALVHSLLSDPYFFSLPEASKEAIKETILSDVKGRMLEDIVLYETSHFLKEGGFAFKFQRFSAGEIDMVVVYSAQGFCDLYEIKHSCEIVEQSQTRHLQDERTLALLASRYGEIRSKNVLYRGPSCKREDVCYQNVTEFLKRQ